MWTLVLTLVFYDGVEDSRSYGRFNSKVECLQYVDETRKIVTNVINKHKDFKEELVYAKIQCTQDVYF